MSKATEQAADVQHNGTPYLRTALTTANGEMCVMPAEWVGKYVEFTAIDCNMFVRFGTSSGVQVDATTVSTNTAGTLAATGKEPHLEIVSGSSKHERILVTWTHFAFICSNATGKVYMCLATGTGA